jgi:hypothetical protein
VVAGLLRPWGTAAPAVPAGLAGPGSAGVTGVRHRTVTGWAVNIGSNVGLCDAPGAARALATVTGAAELRHGDGRAAAGTVTITVTVAVRECFPKTFN